MAVTIFVVRATITKDKEAAFTGDIVAVVKLKRRKFGSNLFVQA